MAEECPAFFPVNTGVRQGCVFAPSLFNTRLDWILGKAMGESNYWASIRKSRVSELVSANNAVCFAKSLEVVVLAL